MIQQLRKFPAYLAILWQHFVIFWEPLANIVVFLETGKQQLGSTVKKMPCYEKVLR